MVQPSADLAGLRATAMSYPTPEAGEQIPLRNSLHVIEVRITELLGKIPIQIIHEGGTIEQIVEETMMGEMPSGVMWRSGYGICLCSVVNSESI